MADKEKVQRRLGTVIDLGGGRFKVKVYVGLRPDGRRIYHRKTLRGSTPKKAQKYVEAIAAQARAGDYFVPVKVTVNQHFEEWLDRQRRNGARQTTMDSLRRRVRLHVVPALGAETPLHKVTAGALQALYDRLQDKGYKPSSIRQIHAVAKAGLKFAVRRGRVKANPAEEAELPPLNRPKKARVFDEEEALRFVEAAWREGKYLIFIFGLLTGMRPSEFFGVQYTDLSLESVVVDGRTVERALVRVRRAVVRGGGGWYFSEPKTAAGKRAVYFPSAVYHELMAQRASHLEELRRLGQTHQLVFTNTLGGPLNRSNLTRRFFAACRKAGVSTQGRSLYTLRRSHATLSLLTGENLKSLSERMGHKDVHFTENEYIDCLPVMQQAAADRLETRLLGTQLAPPECVRTM